MFELTFFGTSAAVPSLKRGMPAFSLRFNELFLFDCGEGTQRQMMRYGVGFGRIKAVFISHLHLDHFLGFFGLAETLHLNEREEPLTVFAPKGFGEMIRAISPASDWKENYLDSNEINEGVLYEGRDFSISAFRVKHSKESYGFIFQEKDKVKFNEKKAKSLGIKGVLFKKIEKEGKVTVDGKTISLGEISWIRKGRKIVYSGDTRSCPAVYRAAEGADILIHESTYAEDRKDEAGSRGHSTAVEAAETAKKARVKHLILTHISGRYSTPSVLEKEAKKVFKNTTIAKDGLRVLLSPDGVIKIE